MQISNSKFHKVWKITIDQNGNKQVNLGDSKKNQDGTFSNWTWAFCKLVGNAKGIQVEENDTITIKSGKIEQYKNKNDEYKNSITIFDFEVTAKGQQGGYGANQQSNSQNVNNNYNSSQSYNQKPVNNGNFEYDIPF